MTGSASALPSVVKAHPRVLRRQAIIWSLVLPGAAVLGWFTLPASLRAQFTAFQVSTLLFFIAVMLGIVWIVAACWVRADAQGISFRNGLKVDRIEWDAVDGVRFWPGDAWAFLDVGDDDRPLLGIQRTDGEATLADIADLRALHAAARGVQPGTVEPSA